MADPTAPGIPVPQAALSKVFRGKYVDFLSTAYRSGELRMPDAHGVTTTEPSST